MPKELLAVADIGGTNSRFALFSADGPGFRLEAAQWLPTEKISDTKALLVAFANSFGFRDCDLAAMVIAIAGPVEENRGFLANASLKVNLAETEIACPAKLINDFEAQAWACLAPCGESATLISGPGEGKGSLAVIGAGTGLGVGLLLPEPSGWRAVPSEAGHTAFPFQGKEENEFQDFLCARLKLGYARGDDTITGRGLSVLHQFLTGEKLAPHEVGQTALDHDCQTLRWYSRFYARACRNWMLTTLCYGGLWIAGGIAAQNPYCVQNPFFLEELHNAPENYLRKIPLRLIADKNSGLWGAAYLAKLLLQN